MEGWRGNREKEESWRKRQRDGETEGENGRTGRMDGGLQLGVLSSLLQRPGKDLAPEFELVFL